MFSANSTGASSVAFCARSARAPPSAPLASSLPTCTNHNPISCASASARSIATHGGTEHPASLTDTVFLLLLAMRSYSICSPDCAVMHKLHQRAANRESTRLSCSCKTSTIRCCFYSRAASLYKISARRCRLASEVSTKNCKQSTRHTTIYLGNSQNHHKMIQQQPLDKVIVVQTTMVCS